jgi:hypothetical protein
VQGESRNCETSVLTNSFVDHMHQVVIHQRWMPTLCLPHHAGSLVLHWTIETHFVTMPSLITLSPYTSQIWQWMQLGRTFLTFTKWITGFILQLAGGGGAFKCLKHVWRRGTDMKITWISWNGVCGLSVDRRSHCTCVKGESQWCMRDMCKQYVVSEYGMYILSFLFHMWKVWMERREKTWAWEWQVN